MTNEKQGLRVSAALFFCTGETGMIEVKADGLEASFEA